MNIHNEEREGFDISLDFEYDDLPWTEDIIGDINFEDTTAKLSSGEYGMYCAVVTASKCGIELASHTLGACIYEVGRELNFLDDGYYEDMVKTVIIEAKEILKELLK